jgi:cell division protein FtsW (lipid II flippase)
MTLTSLLLLLAPVVLLILAARSGNLSKLATTRSLAIVYGLPAIVLVTYCLIWRVPATRILVELHGIAFRADGNAVLRKEIRERVRGGSQIVIGESAARRRRAPQTSFGAFVFDRGRSSIELPVPSKRAGLVGTRSKGLLGAIELEDGDQVCIGKTCWTYADRTFRAGTQTFEIPRREARIPALDWPIPLPFARPVPATARTYSLDVLSRRSADAERIRSIVVYTRDSRKPRLVPLDGDVTLQRGGKAVTAPRVFPIVDGERVSFYTLPDESPEFIGPPIVERRSVVYRAGQRSFALDLDTPEIHSLTPAELDVLRLDDETRKVVPLAMGDAQLVDRSLYFRGISESVALQASSLIELSRWFPRDFRSAMRIVSPRGPADAVVGTTVWVGATDLASVRMLVLRPPLLLLLVALLLQALKIAAAHEARFTLGQALAAGALEMLVAFRLLLGHRVWSMPPHKLEGAELALVAWMMLPWLFLAASLPAIAWSELKRTKPAAWLCAGAGVLVSLVFCAAVTAGPRRYVWILCHIVALAIPLLRAIPIPDKRLRFVWIAAAFCLARIVLLLFGFKESAMLPGGRVSLSAIYVPAACILEGLFLAHIAKTRGPFLRDALLILVLLWTIPAMLTSDVGLALLNVPVFVLLLLAFEPRNRVVRAMVAAIVLFVAGAPLLRLATPLISSEETMLKLASDSNYARFLHFAAPERLEALATKRGESLAITSAILQQYISSGVFGRGYGRSDVTVHLGDTALRDFAPAVFVAAEWGLVGTVALIVVYGLFGFVAWRFIRKSTNPNMAIAAVAAGTIAVASIYMIFANHELVLLTGKNAYLLGLDSAGDLLESFALLLLIASGASSGETS